MMFKLNDTVSLMSIDKATKIVDEANKYADDWTYVIKEGRPGLYRVEAYDEDGEFVGCL